MAAGGGVLVTFNPGSSTIKIGLFAIDRGAARRIGKGMIDLRQQPLVLHIVEGPTAADIPLAAKAADEFDDVLDETLGWLSRHFEHEGLVAAGHRVVHGGDDFHGPVRIDDAALQAIEALVPLAPLHQPQSVRLITAIRRLRPGLPQVASFDTAFHRTQTDMVRRFALPRPMFDEGIKRYGFHGLSYKYISGALARQAPELAQGRIVVAHLGSGASLCGLAGGTSRDTSMGFSTLDGIPMATRSGALDPGVQLHLLANGMSREQLEDLLYHRSGLLGVSGISADSRALLESDAPEAREAIGMFAFRIAQTVAAFAVTLGGLDGIVFTAGIGEHQPEVRALVCGHLGWLGVALDEGANAANALRIEAAGAKVAVLVIPTDEEQVIADEAVGVLGLS
jgi:acetate kinase